MNVFDQARLIIYRINQKGLEIFLVNMNGEEWELPEGMLTEEEKSRIINLEPVKSENGNVLKAQAVEADWHEIPSLRKMLREDVRIVKDQLMEMVPEMEKGTYFAVKEAFRKIMPDQYAILKELKDIVLDRNQVNSI